MSTALTRIAVCIVPCLGLCLSQHAKAGVIVRFQQVGSDVVATGSGSFDTAALTHDTTISNLSAFVQSQNPGIDIGSTETDFRYDDFANFVPANQTGFGSEPFPINASSGTGDNFGFAEFVLLPSPHPALLVVPSTYVSGDPLAGTATWSNATFASLSLVPGSYTYSWGSGQTADFFTVDIGSADAPEPGTLGLLAIAALALLASRASRLVGHLAKDPGLGENPLALHRGIGNI